MESSTLACLVIIIIMEVLELKAPLLSCFVTFAYMIRNLRHLNCHEIPYYIPMLSSNGRNIVYNATLLAFFVNFKSKVISSPVPQAMHLMGTFAFDAIRF